MKTIDIDIEDIKKKWPAINKVLSIYKSQKDYKRAIQVLDYLIDEIGQSEKHPLSSLVDTIGVLIEDYESRNVPEPDFDPIAQLKYLMAEHSLNQSDLSEIGSQGVVSEILSKKRDLNRRQIIALSKRFNVSPLVFIGAREVDVEAA